MVNRWPIFVPSTNTSTARATESNAGDKRIQAGDDRPRWRRSPRWCQFPPLLSARKAQSTRQAVKSGDGEAVETPWEGTCHSSTPFPAPLLPRRSGFGSATLAQPECERGQGAETRWRIQSASRSGYQRWRMSEGARVAGDSRSDESAHLDNQVRQRSQQVFCMVATPSTTRGCADVGGRSNNLPE